MSDDDFVEEMARISAERYAAEARAYDEYIRQVIHACGITDRSNPDRDARIAAHIADLIDCQKVKPSKVTVRSVGAALSIAHATVGRSPVWRAFKTYRDANDSRQVRADELTTVMLAMIADRTANDPSDIAAEREIDAMSEEGKEAVLARLMDQQAREMAKEDARPRSRK